MVLLQKMPHWKCLSNLQFCAFQRKNPTSATLSPPPWNPSCWPDNKFTLEALTVCVRVEGNQVTLWHNEHIWGSTSSSKSLLPWHLKGKERPTSLSARRAFQCGRWDCRRGDGQEGAVIQLGSPAGWEAIVADGVQRSVSSASALTAAPAARDWLPGARMA